MSTIPAKVATGDSDFQAVGIDFADYTLLKDAENRFPIKVSLWRQSRGSRVALMPNLTYMLAFDSPAAMEEAWGKSRADPAWIKLKDDPKYKDTVSNISNVVLRPLPGSQI